MVKSFNFVVKTLLFEGLAGCVLERKGYPKNIKNETEAHTKIHV